VCVDVGICVSVDYGTSVVDGGAVAEVDTAAPLFERYLLVQNESAKKLRIYVQWKTQTPDGWAWLPENVSDPADLAKAQAAPFDLEPGAKTYLEFDGQPIKASRARLWSVSDAGKFVEYKDKDLWLVPEQLPDGTHGYFAAEMQTFTFKFTPNAPQQGMPPADKDEAP
jgi:hypothetical protein